MRRIDLLSLAIALGLLSGCATRQQLDRSLRVGEKPVKRPAAQQVPVHGFSVAITSRVPLRDSEGELLAVEPDQLWLATGKGVVAVSLQPIERVRIEIYPSDALVLTAWSLGGLLSTASHGFFLFVTAPLWLAVGTGVTISAYASNKLDVKPGEFDKLYQYARFPAGLPPGFVPAK